MAEAKGDRGNGMRIDPKLVQAARMLGTERTSLHKRLRALGLKRS